MKKFLSAIGRQMTDFINSKKVDEGAIHLSENVLRNIDLAMRKKAGVHVIFADKSFTGDIIKFDKERGQLIVKNFNKSMSTIIRLSEIKRISIVPDAVRKSQQQID